MCYKWRFGDVYYTKAGSGRPVLLIHDLNASSSGYEWIQMVSFLQERYTVYTIDLLGCGRSEKVNMTYTNYLYVQLISDFIQSEIGHRTDVIVSGESASIVIMACGNNPDLFNRLMLINPLSIWEYSRIPGKFAKCYKMIVDIPILGTLLYQMAVSRQAIREEFIKEGFYDVHKIHSFWIDLYYESAHTGLWPKAVYASQKCNYTKCNIVNALRKINNSIYLVGGEKISHIKERLEEYKKYNPSVEIALVPETKSLLQLEAPDKLGDLIRTYFG